MFGTDERVAVQPGSTATGRASATATGPPVRRFETERPVPDRGSTTLTVPSAFTLHTGRDHWHPLLRARAIENQSFVVAPNQWGHHFGDRSSYGHSAVYDPWGRMLACASDRQTLVHAEIDHDYLEDVRQKMPCLQHGRLD